MAELRACVLCQRKFGIEVRACDDRVVSEEIAQPAIRHLLPHECWAAMGSVTVGRLGFSVDSEQEIFPLNFIADGGTIVFRTSASTRIGLCLDGRSVAFEVDGVADGTAWSVVAKGTATAVRGLYDNLEVAEVPVHPLQEGSKPRLLRIEVVAITGRRFSVADSKIWAASELSDRHVAPE